MISILYVDDEPGLLQIGKLFLERIGEFSVGTETSAIKALEIIKQENYDAIISDYQMPGLDGIEFLKRVRESGNRIPFIIFTGRGREEIVIQALNEGADFYLQKGGEPGSQFAELAHKVRLAVQQRRAEASIRNYERREADILNFLPDATFAIDTAGTVIAWNQAIEKMTGVRAEDIVGKGNYEYAIPFYHKRRPILIDLVLREDTETATKYPLIKREGNKLISEIAIPHFNEGEGAVLWFIASPLYNIRGEVTGAIESIREITERKNVEEALNESERRFRDLADLLPQAIYEADKAGKVTYANRIAFEIYGYTRDDLKTGLNVLDMISPEDRGRAAKNLRQMVKTGSYIEPDNREYRAIRKDGVMFPVSVFSSPIIRNNQFAGVRGIVVDNTDRLREEEKTRESERNYRLLFENATEGILVAQGDRMVRVNPALVEILGRPAEVLLSRPFTDFIHPEDREMVMARHLRRMQGEIPETGYMFRIMKGGGEVRWIWINSTSMFWSGKPASLSFLTDMTERKRAEDGLESSIREYGNLLDQIQDVYYRSDEQGRLIKASKSWAKILGYDDLSECIGKSIADDFYANPEDRQTLLEEVFRDGKVTNYKVLLKRKDGTTVPVETSSHLYYDMGGRTLGLEGTFRDITEQRTQEAILHTQLELGMALQKAHGMQEAMETCLDAAIEISDMDSGGIYIVDEDTGSFDLILSRNLGNSFMENGMHCPAESSGSRKVRVGKPLYISCDELSVAGPPGTQTEGLKSVAIIPIASGGRSIACLSVSSHTLARIPEAAQLPLETIATQIGSVIERIRVEEALAESERRYRNVVEDQTELISRFLPDGTHVFVNEAYCRYFGFNREEILGHRFKPVIPSEDEESVRAFFKSLTPDHPVDTIRHQIVLPDGSIRWQQWSDRAIYDPDGTIIEFQSVGRDISDIKEIELALHEKESWHHSLSEVSNDIIFMIDRDDRVVYVNNAAAAMLGCPPEEIIGSLRAALFPPEIAKTQKMAIEQVLATGRHYRNTGMLTVGGVPRWYDHSLIPVRNQSGAITRVFGISRDITEQKEIEDALQRSKDQLTLAIEGSGIGLWDWHVDTGEVEFNERWAEIIGYTLVELAPIDMETWNRLIYPDDRAIATSLIRKHFAGETPVYECEVRMKHKNGQWVWVQDRGKVTQWGPDGQPVRMTGTHLEITNRKNAEEALKRANRQMKLLTGITRHDILNSIMVADSYLQLMEDPEYASESDSVQMIHHMLQKISRQILFTKEYENLGSQEPVWQNLDTLLMHLEIPSAVVFMPGSCRAEVLADSMLIKVFENLLENSIRYGGTGLTCIRMTGRGSDEGFLITWEDDGKGVSPDEKDRIFERGYGEGSGLGLFFSREILGITGITIRENGVPEKGARFEILVPEGHFRFVPEKPGKFTGH